MFSYGVILWELYTLSNESKANLSDNNNVLTSVLTSQYVEKLKSGLRPNIPSQCPKDFGDLIKQCWEYEPQKKPTFDQVVSYLEDYFN